MTPNILLTGGSGFLGSALLNNLAFKEAIVMGRTQPKDYNNFVSRTLDSITNYEDILCNIDVVVHAAGLAHVMDSTSQKAMDAYRNINTLATLNLAEQAMAVGVKRFVFISSIKVLGEQTKKGRRYTYSDKLNPKDPYAISKAEAENGLRELSAKSAMEVVIIRPPLVYGKGVKGNFERLLKLSALQIPLPLKSIENKRSFVAVENLVDLICTCLFHPKAKNQVFLVSDNFDMATPELLNLLAIAGGYRSRLFSFPDRILEKLLMCLGKSRVYDRLCGSMEVDISHTINLLDWQPPVLPKDSILNCWPDRR